MYTVRRTRTIGTQAATNPTNLIDKAVQISSNDGLSYNKGNKSNFLTYDDLVQKYIGSTDQTIRWLQEIGLIASRVVCPKCETEMNLVSCQDCSDGLKWQCRQRSHSKHQTTEQSIRKDSWFENSNMTLIEVVKFTYWWCANLTQKQIIQQLKMSPNTAVDWSMFCHKVCLTIIQNENIKIRGIGKRVQIDETKVGKRKYHRGHLVEGQWVFGGIEEQSRNSFIIPVDDRSETTLVGLAQTWILPGTTIISDCWKGYINLENYGYIHKTVNHSQEFVNIEGDHTNKIEGHWRQLKSNLPTHGRKKDHYASYFAEFMWKYKHHDDDCFLTFLQDMKKLYNPSTTE